MLRKLVLCALTCVGAPAVCDPVLVSDFIWEDPQSTFGGLSGIVMNADGTQLIAITDRSRILTGDVQRKDGVITAVTASETVSLDTNGPRDDGVTRRDSEGLAIAPSGDIFVSFEGVSRVTSYAQFDGAPTELTSPDAFADFPENGSLEALAIDRNGVLFTIPERSGNFTRPFPIYRYQNGQWDVPYVLPRVGSFLVVGADFGPQGRLYILERQFGGLGFRTRVRRFDFETMTLETILTTQNATHGNLEGISLWTNAAGETIMTMISDDNFQFFLETEIVEYRLDD